MTSLCALDLLSKRFALLGGASKPSILRLTFMVGVGRQRVSWEVGREAQSRKVSRH